VLIHDAVWILPADAKTREALEWLAEEIEEQGGTAWVWEAASLSRAQDRETVELFRREADGRYAEIGASAQAIRDAVLGRRRSGRRQMPARPGLAHAERQLRGLERALRLERRRDYFLADGRAAAAELVNSAIVEVQSHRASPPREGVRRALGD
jgi:hypothetical protein